MRVGEKPIVDKLKISTLGRGTLFFLWLLSLALLPWLVMGPFGHHLVPLWRRAVVFGPIALGGAVVLKAVWPNQSWFKVLLIASLSYGVAYQVATYIPGISTYPLSLGWSEASRYYYASLYFSKQIYGIAVPPTVLHPSRYLMQAAPFLIPNLPIWFHRLWQVLLWLGFALGTAILLARRLTIPDRMQRWLFVAWAFLFIFQGPVYYHLLVMVMIVLAGFNRQRFWQSMIAVGLASIWAGISRINWFPVPAMLATALYFLEQNTEKKPLWQYLLPPILWVGLGTSLAFLSQSAYIAWSGNPSGQFGSSLTSDLLWYRLFPNVTYRMGILPSIFVASLPLGLLILFRLVGRWRRYHPIRILGLVGILLALFAVGIVVSVKIGGGSNLHNLDAYLIALLIMGSTIYYGKFVEDDPEPERQPQPAWGLVSLAVIVPVLFTLSLGGPVSSPNWAKAREAIREVQGTVDTAVQGGGKVLFITERQLLTFHTLEGVPLELDYEKVFLMEMGMSNNSPYLTTLYDYLRNQRFALIISEPMAIQYQGRTHQFGEENDAWVKRVAEPVLCYYQPQTTFHEVAVQILVPRQGGSSCP